MSSAGGRFLVIEGTDGSGTTTQCDLLVAALVSRGVRALATREPTGGPVGVLLRSVIEKRLQGPNGLDAELDWKTLALLFAADRVEHVYSEIAPALASGVWVVSDRYALSSYIYQSLTAPDPKWALEWVHQINAAALRPDLVLVLDVDAATAEERRRLRGGKEELFERRELQRKLALAYRAAEIYASGDVIEHVDGNRAQAEVAASIWKAVCCRTNAIP